MFAIYQWLVDNWPLLAQVLGAILALAALVTRLTPTPKDDAFIARLLGWLSFLRPADVRGVKAPFTRLPKTPTAKVRTRL